MLFSMKKIIATVFIVIACLSAGLICFKVVRARRQKAVQAQRKTAYREAMRPFQRDLSLAMARADVEDYLLRRKVQYGPSEGGSYFVQIGEEPGDSLVCDRWSVYVALDFKSATLSKIHIQKIGHCL